MKNVWNYFLSRIITGFIVIVPLYLCVLLLLKITSSLARLMRPITIMFPDWLPGENLLALLVILLLCLLVGAIVRTRIGYAVQQRFERSFFQRIPGYTLFRSLTQRLAGESEGKVWQPALAEIEEALVPAFLIEELDDGRYTVFVPSSPSPFAGTVYILERNRVHPINIPFKQAIRVISRWGEGAKELVADMERNKQT
jgi:uncharacterized membrane protein